MRVRVLTKPNTTNHQQEEFKENENRQELNINSFSVLVLVGRGYLLSISFRGAPSLFPQCVA